MGEDGFSGCGRWKKWKRRGSVRKRQWYRRKSLGLESKDWGLTVCSAIYWWHNLRSLGL